MGSEPDSVKEEKVLCTCDGDDSVAVGGIAGQLPDGRLPCDVALQVGAQGHGHCVFRASR